MDIKWFLPVAVLVAVGNLTMIWLAVHYRKKNTVVSRFAIFGLVVIDFFVLLVIRKWI